MILCQTICGLGATNSVFCYSQVLHKFTKLLFSLLAGKTVFGCVLNLKLNGHSDFIALNSLYGSNRDYNSFINCDDYESSQPDISNFTGLNSLLTANRYVLMPEYLFHSSLFLVWEGNSFDQGLPPLPFELRSSFWHVDGAQCLHCVTAT